MISFFFLFPSREDFFGDQQINHSQEADINIMASLEQDFPTLGTSSSHVTPRLKFLRDSSNRLTFNDQNFPALEAGVNLTNNVDASGSTSGPNTTTTKMSVQNSGKKPKQKKVKNAQNNGHAPSTSTLSSTWVDKAKEKPVLEKTVVSSSSASSDSLAKPPAMNRHNFPNLQKKNGTSENINSSVKSRTAKKNQKSPAVGFEVDESNFPIMRINYSEAIVKNAAVQREHTKSKTGASSNTAAVEETKDKRALNLVKDTKTHSFLLNANRKKVKMKPEVLIPLNDLNRSHELLPIQMMKPKVTNNSNEIQDVNISTVKDKKLKDVDAKIKGTAKDSKEGTKRGRVIVQKEPGALPRKADEQGVPKKDNVFKLDASKMKQEMNKNSANTVESMESAFSASTSKPPPGFERSITPPPPPPPGFNPLITFRNDSSSDCKNLSEGPFVYQQPDKFNARNSQLIEKIGNSLTQRSDEALNEFKNISLLFREGYLLASDYYLYCLENIDADKFEEVFIDLIALLPNISKQQVSRIKILLF